MLTVKYIQFPVNILHIDLILTILIMAHYSMTNRMRGTFCHLSFHYFQTSCATNSPNQYCHIIVPTDLGKKCI